MSELVTALPALSALIERGGIIGVLLVVCGVMAWEIARLRKVLGKTYAQRDKWRLAFVTVKAAADHAGLKIDLSGLADLLNGDDA